MLASITKKGKPIMVTIDTLGRVMGSLLTIWSTLTLLLFLGFYLNFVRDFPFLLRVNIHINLLFDLCQYLNLENQPYSLSIILLKIIFNVILVSAFFYQHIFTARLHFKLRVSTYVPQYLLIERPMYNLASQLIFMVLMSLWQPIDLILVDLSKYENIILILGVFGVSIVICILFNDEKGDFLGWRFSKKLWTSSQISFNQKYITSREFIIRDLPKVYYICRHPMHLGACIITICTGSIWSISRTIFSISMLVGISIDSFFEDERQQLINPSYEEYKKLSPNRILPNVSTIFNTWGKIFATKTRKIQEKED